MAEKDTLERVIKFNGKNFPVWKLKMFAYLAEHKLMEVVLKDESKLGDDKEKEKAITAYSVLIRSISDEQAESFIHIPMGNAYKLWQALVQRYERKTVANKAHIREQLAECIMEKNEVFDKYVARIRHLTIQLQEMGETVQPSELMHLLLRGLPQTIEYKSLVQTLKVNNKLDFDEVCEHIRDCQDAQIREEKKSSETKDDNAYYASKTGYRG